MGYQLGAPQAARGDAHELHQLRREVLELRIQNVRLLAIIQQRGIQTAWHGTYVHEPTGVRVTISTVGGDS